MRLRLRGGGGARIRVGTYWSVRLGARHLRVSDADEAFLGEPLRYTVGVLWVQLRAGP